MKRAAFILMAVLAVPAWLAAQTPVDERRPAAADGVVEIENMAGSVKVIGWDEAAVQVTGTLAAGAELDVRELRASAPRSRSRSTTATRWRPASDLEVHVPAGSHVEIDGVRLDVEVSGVTGSVEVETVDGGITQSGAAQGGQPPERDGHRGGDRLHRAHPGRDGERLGHDPGARRDRWRPPP